MENLTTYSFINIVYLHTCKNGTIKYKGKTRRQAGFTNYKPKNHISYADPKSAVERHFVIIW